MIHYFNIFYFDLLMTICAYVGGTLLALLLLSLFVFAIYTLWYSIRNFY